jgi:hypothetical protein
MQVLKVIIAALSNKGEGVRAAGATCIMALSRSVKTLRSAVSSPCVINLVITLCNVGIIGPQVYI